MKLLWSHSSRRVVSLFLCAITLVYLTGCHHYKVVSYDSSFIPQLEAMQVGKKMILHNGNNDFHVKTIFITPEAKLHIELDSFVQEYKIVEVTLSPYWSDEVTKRNDTIRLPYYYYSGEIGSYIYSPKKQKPILEEVHLYTTEYIQDLNLGIVELNQNQLREIRVINYQAGKSAANTIIAAVGIGMGVALGSLLIALALKSSCPFIYVYDGQQMAFQGEIFSGAVMNNLERHDYLPLPLLKPQQRELHLRIANELPEKQYVNQIELIAIPHAAGTEVILDEQGNPQSITQPQLPVKALSAMGKDQKELISSPDQQAFQFDEIDVEKNSLNLTFPRPPQASQAKLVLNARNSMWFDQLFARFAEKMGTFYPTWMEHLSAMPREERIQQQIDQDFPLSVFLKTDDGQWQLAHRFNLAGPLAWRDIVVPLDLTHVSGNTLEMRLETGFLFWEIDYVALDYSANADLKVVPIPLKKAKDQDGNSQVTALSSDDSQYLTQPQPGLFTDLYFTAPKVPIGQEVDYFLHSKGYYEHIRHFQNLPNMAELEQFRQAHAFDQFSKAEYMRLLNTTSAETQNKQ